MRHLRGGKNIIGVLALLLVALITWSSRRDAGHSPPPLPTGQDRSHTEIEVVRSDTVHFDFYLLAMTLHPAFCADGHARKSECLTGNPVPLSIHGLWPEKLQPGKYPRDCPVQRLQLDALLLAEMRPLMPGMADGLHEHEWRKHGGCSNLDDDEYFQHTVVLARRLDSALREELTTMAGRETSARNLRGAAERFERGLGGTLTFHCRTLKDAPPAHRHDPYLIEIRQCIDNDGNAHTRDTATLRRRGPP